jgi:uncharacterized protein YfkK (UPF0435 family)
MSENQYEDAMKWIHTMLQKQSSLGSVKLGQETATFYLEKINEMLNSDNRTLIEELKLQVVKDSERILADCKRRVQHQDVTDNKYMILNLQDYILSL